MRASARRTVGMAAGPGTRRVGGAVRSAHGTVVGHCTGRLIGPNRQGGRPESEFDAATVFEACREAGVAVEINCRPERQDPPDRLLRIAADMGCQFSIDTDAHAPGQLDWQIYGCARAEECEVPAERVVTTWPVEKLLDWSRGGV